MAQIKDLTLSRLRQEESFGFHQLANAETVQCDDPKLTALQTAYTAAITAFDESLKTGGANPLSASINELDANRDEAYSGMAAQVRNARRHFDPAKAAVAREAELIVRKYGNPCALPLVEENGALHNLIQELKAFNNYPESDRPEEVSADKITTNRLDAIGALDWLEQLETMNKQFLAVFADRNTALSAIVTGASKATRLTADNAYRAVARRVNALAEVNGDTAYIGVINALNELIDRQKAVLSARETANARKNETKINANQQHLS